MIELENPIGETVEFDPSAILIIFYSELLSPPGAKGNLIYDGTIRSVRDTPAAIVKKIGSQAKLVEFTLPKGGLGSAQGSAWFAVAGIGRVTDGAGGALLKMKGQPGTVQVVETVDRVKDLVAAAK